MSGAYSSYRVLLLGSGRYLSASALLLCAAFAPEIHAEQQRSSVGLGMGITPDYPGADSYHATPLPSARLFDGRFFLQGGDAGLNFALTDSLSAGPLIAYSGGRDAKDNQALAGLDDIDSSLLYGAFVRWQPGRFSLEANYLRAADSDQGAAATLSLGYLLYQNQRHQIQLGVATQWRDGDNMQTWFGIDERQSAMSDAHYAPYHARAGIAQVTPQLRWRYQFADNWQLSTGVGYTLLTNEAKDSPLVEKKSDLQGAIGVNYQF